MANIRVKDLPNTNAANDNDEFIVDSSTSGTRRLSYAELKSEISTDFAADVATYGIATLDSDNKLTASQIPDSLAQGMNFVGVANSAGDLTSTTQGDFYVIQTAFGVYSVGDQAVYDGSAYVRVVDGTKEIAEGGTGATTLDDAKGNLEVPDVGTAPNEVPLNGMLGDMAYQSSEGISAGTVSAETLEVESTTGTGSTQALTVTDGTDTNFVVQEDGKTGIGTASPGSYAPDANNLVVGSGSGSEGLTIATDASSQGGIYFARGTSGGDLYRGHIFYDQPSDSFSFATGATVRWKISSAGHLISNNGLYGIDFGSGASTTLDDYEEGTHTTTATPSSSGSITLNGTSDTLSYTRVGRKVTVSGALGVSAVSSPVGNYINFTLPLQIADLDELSGHFAGSCVVLNAAGSMGSYSIIGLDGESSFRLYKNTSNSAVATAPDFSGDETIYVSVTYFTTA